MSDEHTREVARSTLQDAVHRMLEAGFSPDEIEGEVTYTLENAADDSA